MNRGVARRTIFDGASDFRFLLAEFARARRRGEIEIHAYALMRTHFHLILRSLEHLADYAVLAGGITSEHIAALDHP